jgi:hypothetical protein
MIAEEIINSLLLLNFKNCFNPYVDFCPTYDSEDAPLKRRGMLLRILNKACMSKDLSLWIGRDLGYRGGRRTGMALTDDINFHSHGKRWDLDLVRPTHGVPCSERTATVIWDQLSMIDKEKNPIFLWNVFPLHPFEEGFPFTNRSHNALERRAGEQVLMQLFELLNPTRIVAIGNDAAASVHRIAPDLPTVHVRHPSYGGQTDFTRAIRKLYKLDQTEQSCLF